MTSKVADFLKKPAIKQNEEKAVSQLTAKPTGRSIALSDGREVALDDIKPEDSFENQKRFELRTGKGYKQRAVGYRSKKLPIDIVDNPISTFVEPEWIKAPKPDDKWNDKQKAYRRNILTSEDIRKPLPKVTRNIHNRQRLTRFVFVNELIANKNGFIYYTLPIILNVIFLLLNAFRFDFGANIIFSIVALTDWLLLWCTIKSDKNIIIKAIYLCLIVALNVGLYFLGSIIPGLYGMINVPYMLKLFLIITCIYSALKFYVGVGICYKGDCSLDFGNVVQINAGKPRCGKTSSAVQDVFVLAKLKWQQLQYDYYIMRGREKEILKRNNRDELLERQEIIIAYNYYIMRPCIPCLWSIIGIFDKQGRAAHQITLDHLKGLKRLPVYSVVCLDEIGAILKADDGLNRKDSEKPLDVSDMFRLGGHYIKWIVIGCEQDFHHIYIDCRRVVGFNKVILGQEWVCRPTLAYGLLRFLKLLKLGSYDKKIGGSRKYALFLYKFEKFVRSIGFRRIKYQYANNTQTNAGLAGQNAESEMQLIGGVRTRWCPSCLIANYDDRAYKQKYPSYFDREIKGELHKAMHINALDENTAQFVNTTAALSEKWDAIKEEVEKIT